MPSLSRELVACGDQLRVERLVVYAKREQNIRRCDCFMPWFCFRRYRKAFTAFLTASLEMASSSFFSVAW